MLRLTTITILCFTSLSAHARDLHIPRDTQYRITPAEQTLQLDSLVLGDGATVTFADGVSQWDVSARKVAIGEGVVIDGRGEAGAPGGDGAGAEGAAEPCEDGAAGGNGGDGGAGGDGVSMRLNWGIAELGSLKILTDGGPGGRGGAGGRGQHGGEIAKCRGGAGGPGGSGGAGGDGGKAGSVQLIYWPVGSGPDMDVVSRRITVSSSGGAGGAAGPGGPGGEAVDGRYMRGSFAGNKKWLAGGEPGAEGASGSPGVSGRDGAFDLKQDFAKFSGKKALDKRVTKHLPAGDATDTVPLQKRLLEMERRLQALEERLQRLEQNRAKQ